MTTDRGQKNVPAVVSFGGLSLRQWQLLRREFSLKLLWERMAVEDRSWLCSQILLHIRQHALTPELKRQRREAGRKGIEKTRLLYGDDGHRRFAALRNSAAYRRAPRQEKDVMLMELRDELLRSQP